MTHRRLALIAVLAGLAMPLGGCVGLAVGAGAAAGVAVAEDRSVGQQIDDATIYTAVNEGLFRYNETLFQDVGVEVTEGRVLLTGQVPTEKDRADAVRIAWQADGVKEVINEIQVTKPGGLDSYLADMRISNELRAELLFDKDVSSINYNVDTVGQIVYLSGIAANQAELNRVIAHARTISGVKQVISHVRVKGPTPASGTLSNPSGSTGSTNSTNSTNSNGSSGSTEGTAPASGSGTSGTIETQPLPDTTGTSGSGG